MYNFISLTKYSVNLRKEEYPPEITANNIDTLKINIVLELIIWQSNRVRKKFMQKK